MTGHDITRLLNRAAEGDTDAAERAWQVVYGEVYRIAERERARGGGDTLSTTGLVHEAYVKLSPSPPGLENRAHFYALACRAMRQVLVDRSRRRRAEKRGGGVAAVTLNTELAHSDDSRDEALVDLDEALTRLGVVNPRLVRVVECHFFGGLSFPETAAALDISLRTAERDWARARAHLYRMLHPDD